MKLFTQEQYTQLRINGFMKLWGEKKGITRDFYPVVKLFALDTEFIWLLSEIGPKDLDLAYGLCDDDDKPYLGYVSLSRLTSQRNMFGFIECEDGFEATKTLSQYAAEARSKGRIIA